MVKIIRFYLRIINHGVIRQGCQSWYIRHVYVLVYFHVFVCSLLLRCMFKVWRVTCGSEDLIQYTMSAGSFSGVGGGGAGGTSAPPKVLVKIGQNP